MSKYFGKIGFAITEETSPGVYKERIREHEYYGDVLKFYRRTEGNDKVNSDINISNEISIVADPFAYNNFKSIRYATFMHVKWKVNSVDVQYPRLNLSLGGEYHGEDED